MRDAIQTEHTQGAGKRILFVLGWGVTLQDKGILWFNGQARKQGWNMLAVRLPTGYRSFEVVLEQIKTACQTHKPDALISFSMGALFAAYIDVPQRIFISPYWGNPKNKLIFCSYSFTRTLMKLLRWINIPLIPRGYKIGDIGTIDVSDHIPACISPAMVHEFLQAQSKRPAAWLSDRIFYCPTDTIIDTSKCNEAVSFTFNGGHDFMATPDRDAVFAKLVEIVDPGSEFH